MMIAAISPADNNYPGARQHVVSFTIITYFIFLSTAAWLMYLFDSTFVRNVQHTDLRQAGHSHQDLC